MESELFILELPLIIEKWQADLLNKRYEYLRQIYNFAQHRLLNQFKYFEQTREYKNCKKKSDFFKTHKFKFKESKNLEITFTKFGILGYISKLAKYKISKDKTYKDFGINTTNIDAIANHIWASWEKKLYGKGKKIHFKKYGDINTIFLRKKSNTFTGLEIDLIKMLIHFNLNGKIGKDKKSLILKIDINNWTNYEQYALKDGFDSIQCINIVRKEIRGKYKYYIQLTIEGVKPNKNRKLGIGKVGIDLGPSEMAICSKNKVKIIKIAEQCDNIEHQLWLLQRKMDRSRRITNPDNYKENGTCKAKKDLKPWYKSNQYKKLEKQRKELYRKQAAVRKLQQTIIANELLSLGDTFIIEKNPINSWAKKTKETKINKRGKYMSKKRFGKSIANHAPAQQIMILKNKVKSLGGNIIEVDIKNAATQFDFTNNTFTKHDLNERKIILSNGDIHYRDLLAAFNLQHIILNNDLKEYNIEDMKKDYNDFCRLEQEELYAK